MTMTNEILADARGSEAALLDVNAQIKAAVFAPQCFEAVPAVSATTAFLYSGKFDAWRGQLDLVMMERSGHHLEDLASMPPLAECHELGMDPLETYLWHVREPQWPTDDVYEALAAA